MERAHSDPKIASDTNSYRARNWVLLPSAGAAV
jgi:hypothetical protein